MANASIRACLAATLWSLLTLTATGSSPPPASGTPAPEFVPHQLLVKFRPGIEPAAAHALLLAHGARATRTFRTPRRSVATVMSRWWLMTLAPEAQVKAVLEALAAEPRVEVAEPNYVLHASVVPNDPGFRELWGLDNRDDADIDAPEAWDVTTGSADVVVAVIDTGVDYTHPDLAANIWTNPGEIPGNLLDDDLNGYPDDIHGYDFYSGDGDPFDENRHGTHVAGTIGAAGDNGVGVVGVGWRVRLMAVRFLGPGGGGSVDGAIDAVLYAADMGARVLNNSWGGGAYSQALRDAIVAANEAGALFVAAAGNNASDNDFQDRYPSNYDVANVLAVAATGPRDDLAVFSSYGASSVDLGAPGVDIISTVPMSGPGASPSGYGMFSGTSMAAPHVAGAAALLLAQDPSRTPIGLKMLLMSTTDRRASLAGKIASGGRLNAHRALTCRADSLYLSVSQPTPGFHAYLDEPHSLSAWVYSCDRAVLGASVTASFDNGDSSIVLVDDGEHGDGAANDGQYAASWMSESVGAVNVTLAATRSGLAGDSVTVAGKVRERPIPYVWLRSPYAWNDVTGGTRLGLTDNSGEIVQIGFPFTFYGTEYTEVTVTDNGYLTFGSIAWNWANVGLPSRRLPNNVIAPFWDDLVPTAGAIYSKLEGVTPHRQFTVAWLDMRHYSAGGAVSFQVVLREGQPDIEFRYQDVIFSDPLAMTEATSYDFGASATVGVENDDGTHGTQISFNQASLVNRTALTLAPEGQEVLIANPGGPYAGAVNTPIAFDGSASLDRNGRPLTYRWTFGDGASATGARPTHAYATPGAYRISLIVNNGERDSRPGTTTATVIKLSENSPPDAANDAAAVAEDEGIDIDVLANDADADGDHLLITAVSVPTAGGSAEIAGDRVHYQPATDFHGTERFVYTVSDGIATDLATVTVTVLAANEPPLAGNDLLGFYEDNCISTNLLANDSDIEGDPLSILHISDPPNGTARATEEGWITYCPDPDHSGHSRFEYTIGDGYGTDVGIVDVYVAPSSAPPDAQDDFPPAVAEDGSIVIDVTANDTDPHDYPLWVRGVQQPEHGKVEHVSKTELRYTPDPDYNGTDSFIYHVYQDIDYRDNPEVDTAVVHITVTPAADPPVARDDVAAVDEDHGASIQVLSNDFDPDGDSVFITALGAPDRGGTVMLIGSEVHYTPAANVHGTERFTYTIGDGSSGSATATVTITVVPINDVPQANDDTARAARDGGSQLIAVLANDVDADDDALTVVAVSQGGAGGTVTIAMGGAAVTYAPAPGFSGTEAFTYTAGDGQAEDPATVLVNVSALSSAVGGGSHDPTDNQVGGAMSYWALLWAAWLASLRRHRRGYAP